MLGFGCGVDAECFEVGHELVEVWLRCGLMSLCLLEGGLRRLGGSEVGKERVEIGL